MRGVFGCFIRQKMINVQILNVKFAIRPDKKSIVEGLFVALSHS